MGICLKSHSSKGAELELRTRPAATYSNDEENDTHRQQLSWDKYEQLTLADSFARAEHAEQRTSPLSPREILVPSAHRSEEQVRGVLSLRRGEAPR